MLPERVVQLHPTTRCNLACAHCYSSSAPGDAPSLDPETVVGALAVLAEAGYRVLSISGGEPFLYDPLAEVTAAATELGFHVSLVTNGAAATAAKVEALAGSVGTAAVSFDGRPERHDVIRDKRGSFALAERGLRRIAEAGITVGVITCVTRHNLGDVPWLYERAVELGAALLQLRPLALTGRARTNLLGDDLDDDDLVRLALTASLLAGIADRPFVQCDLASADDLRSDGRRQFGLLGDGGQRASDLVNPLVVAEDGSVRPFVYGLDQRWHLASIADVASGAWSGPDAAQREGLAALVRATFDALESVQARFVDWYAVLTDVAGAGDLSGCARTGGL